MELALNTLKLLITTVICLPLYSMEEIQKSVVSSLTPEEITIEISDNNEFRLLTSIAHFYAIHYFSEQIENATNLKELVTIKEHFVKNISSMKSLYESPAIFELKKKYLAKRKKILDELQKSWDDIEEYLEIYDCCYVPEINFLNYDGYYASTALSFTLGRLSKYHNSETNKTLAFELFKKLITNFDPNVVFLCDPAPLKLANTNLAIVKLFVEHGGDMRPFGRDTIQEARKNGNIEIEKYVEEQQKLQLLQPRKYETLNPSETLKNP